MNKPKVYIFGAGGAGQNFIELEKDSLEILGLFDNDSKKHNQMLNGIKIMSPNILLDINSSSFDNVIVASMYVDSIVKQLKELGIDEKKNYYSCQKLS